METLTREEIEMCEMAVAIVTDTRKLTDDNKAKWDMLWNKLERMQKVACRPTQDALNELPCGHTQDHEHMLIETGDFVCDQCGAIHQ